MKTNIELNQGDVIANLNKYLEWHNLPLRLSTEGVCNGLSTVRAKYYLEGRKDEFLNMLRYVAGKKPNSKMELAVNHFAVEILLSQAPNAFDKKLRQRDAHKILDYKKKTIEQAFSMSMTTSDENWIAILKELALKDNEVLNIQSTCHAISITKEKDHYVIYDPSFGFKEFSNEEELIQDLHQNVFHYVSGPLYMFAQVLMNTSDQANRTFPVPMGFYDKYLTKDNINEIARYVIAQYPTYSAKAPGANIIQAAHHDDATAVKKLIDLGATDIDYAIFQAIASNAPNAFKVLLEHCNFLVGTRDEVIRDIIHLALKHGSNEIYDTLINNERCTDVIADIIKIPDNALVYIHLAAIGGNVELLEKIMAIFNPLPANILTKLENKDAILAAIEAGSLECVELLLKKLNDASHPLSEGQRLQYLLQAIQKNQPNIILSSHLLTKIPLEDEQSILKLFIATLSNGREDTFDALLENEPYKEIVKKAINDEINTAAYIHAAATSGNPRLLEKIMSKISLNDSQIANKIMEGNAIDAAGSTECRMLLCNKVNAEREKNEPYFYRMMVHIPIIGFFLIVAYDHVLFNLQKRSEFQQKSEASINQAEKLQIDPNKRGFSQLMQAIVSRLRSFTGYRNDASSASSIKPTLSRETMKNLRLQNHDESPNTSDSATNVNRLG